MDNIKEILLIGPGNSLETLDPNLIKTTPTLYFGGWLKWFQNNNVCPTYWTFIDPNTITFFDKAIQDKDPYTKEFLTKLKKETTIIYNNIQGQKEFYELGFTTSRGLNWVVGDFYQNILPRVESYFKQSKVLDTVVTIDNYNTLFDEAVKHVCPIVRWSAKDGHGNPRNIDKFVSYLIPLLISQFQSLKTIKVIGLGDFNTERLYSFEMGVPKSTQEVTYQCFKDHFDFMRFKLIDLLEKKNIEIKFLNKDSYFNKFKK